MSRSPCVRCGNLLHTGEGKITVTFSLDELEALALAAPTLALTRRLACAVGLLELAR